MGFLRDFEATLDLEGPGAAACRLIKDVCAVGVDDMRNPLRPILRALPFLPEARAQALNLLLRRCARWRALPVLLCADYHIMNMYSSSTCTPLPRKPHQP